MAPNEPTFSHYGNDIQQQMSEYNNGVRLDAEENRNPPLQTLFDLKYLRQPMTLMQWVALLVYTPFGTIIAFIRLVAVILVCLFATLSERFLPWTISDKTVFKLIMIITGVYIRKLSGKLPTEKELAHAFVVGNHTITGDPGILSFLYHNNARVVYKVGLGGFDIICRHKILVGGDKAQVKKQILDSIESDPTPVVIYPEGATTNGRSGILRFSAFIFGLDRPIIPVGIRYYPAFPFLASHIILPYYTINMLVNCFMPWTGVDAHVLPIQRRAETETPEQFADRTQKLIANAIGLVPTTYSAADKTAYRNTVQGKKPKQH